MAKPQTINKKTTAATASERTARQFGAQIAYLEDQLKTCLTRWSLTETLGKLGSWEIDLASGELTWSEGTYRVFGLSPDVPLTIERARSFYTEAAAATIDRHLQRAIATGIPYDVTAQFQTAQGKMGWMRALGHLEVAAGSRRIVGVIEDVTAEKEAQDRLRKLAFQDALTDLPNRRFFQDHLFSVAANPSSAALCLIDIDQFKTINDVHGHAVGDRLLQEVARRLKNCVRPGDVAVRLGGDEFAVILNEVETPGEAEARARSFLEAVRRPIPIDGDALLATISVGIAMHDAPVATADRLLRCADIALYRAKSQGRDRACLFRPEFLTAIEQHARVLADVREALRRHEFDVFYQPIVDLRTQVIRGFEALARWRHPTRGVLPPAAFLAALHDPVLSVEIDDFVMDRSLWQARQWLDAGVPLTAMNVNLSEAQLRRGDLVERVEFLLARHGLTPDRLKVEVLETAFLGRQTEQIADTLDRLAKLGVVSALDDFGTGFASLTHLKQFRISKIKIDRSFITNIRTNAYDKAIVKSMIDLGRNTGVRVTAEGVETLEQLAVLRAMDCDCGQGYLFGRPISGADTPAAVRDWYAGKAQAVLGDVETVSKGPRPLQGFGAEPHSH